MHDSGKNIRLYRSLAVTFNVQGEALMEKLITATFVTGESETCLILILILTINFNNDARHCEHLLYTCIVK